MSERSAKWLKKRSFLDQREAEVKHELSEASEHLEASFKKVLMASVAVGATVATGYILYRVFSKPEKKPEKEARVETVTPRVIKVKKAPKLSLKNMLIERLALSVLQVVGTQIAILLSKDKEDDENIIS